MSEAAILSLLGLAQRARRIISGDQMVEQALRKGSGELLLIAGDCGRNNREKYIHLAEREGIRHVFFGTKATLGRAIGKADRVALLVTDRGFAAAITERGMGGSE